MKNMSPKHFKFILPQNKCFFKEFFWIFLLFYLLKSFVAPFLKNMFHKTLSKKWKESFLRFV